MKRHLPGKRVLVVEDNPVLAFDLNDCLASAGVQTIGPALCLQSGLGLIRQAGVDAAVLDIHLGDEDLVWPIANELRKHEIPMIFVTGGCARHDVPDKFRNAPFLEKPVRHEDVLLEVENLFAA